ncbi:MAG: NUDIX hydrolase [Burkholderiaceae bacterium]|jgi:ADP-ribose pyrophosphatase YjhB (NUDIX family)|nr:NUDIX hydrolase [Burkholderiaceae bacterium]
MSDIWRPYIVVAAVIEHEGRFLLVEERESDGSLTLNQPGGLLEAGESLEQAVAREALEESAYDFYPDAFLGVYHLNYRMKDGSDISYIRFAFTGTIGALRQQSLDPDIVRTVWMTKDELVACRERHRSVVVMQCIDDYLAGKRAPLSAVSRYTMINRT